MSAGLPDQIDLRRAVSGSAYFEGELAICDLPRLREAVVEAVGVVRYVLELSRDSEGRSVIRMALGTVLRLECQRCLAPFDYQVATSVALAVIGQLEEADRLPEPYDPLLLEGRLVRPWALIEDELLLALPLIPSHAPGRCGDGDGAAEATAAAEAAGTGPFAPLAGWRQKHPH